MYAMGLQLLEVALDFVPINSDRPQVVDGLI